MIEKKRPVGRPLRDYDPKLFENLCKVMCTVDEIEAILETNQATIDKWCLRYYKENFCTVYKRFMQGGKASLRRTQFKHAQNNTSMCIWLGKQYLGQKDQEKAEQMEAVNKSARDIIEAADKIAEAACESKPETD